MSMFEVIDVKDEKEAVRQAVRLVREAKSRFHNERTLSKCNIYERYP